MPITAACTFCSSKVKVPDHLLGAKGKPSGATAPVPARMAAPPSPLPPPVAPPVPTPSRVPVVEFTSVAAEPFQPLGARSSWVNPWGGFAFVLAAVALLFAALAWPRYVVLPITGLGLLVSLAGVMAARESWTLQDGLWLSLGGGANLLFLLLSVVLPSWLNSRWGRDFDVPETDRNQQVLVSRDGKPAGKDLTGNDWVEADKNAIQQGSDVLIRLENVVVDRPPGKDQPALLITLHLGNVGPLRDFTYHGQKDGEFVPLLRDSRGKELQRQILGDQAQKAGQLGAVSVLPFHTVNDVLVFEPPWTGTDHLELEMPAAAWGRAGVCKFKVPSAMIRHKGRTK
jgi:hypothetical protein